MLSNSKKIIKLILRINNKLKNAGTNYMHCKRAPKKKEILNGLTMNAAKKYV